MFASKGGDDSALRRALGGRQEPTVFKHPNSGPKVARSAEPRVETTFRHCLIAVGYDSQRLSTRREFNGRREGPFSPGGNA